MLHYLFCDFCIHNIQIFLCPSLNSPGVKRFPGQFCQIYHILSLLKFDPSVTFLPFKIRQIPNIFPSLAQINSQAWTQPLLFTSLCDYIYCWHGAWCQVNWGPWIMGNYSFQSGLEGWKSAFLCQTKSSGGSNSKKIRYSVLRFYWLSKAQICGPWICLLGTIGNLDSGLKELSPHTPGWGNAPGGGGMPGQVRSALTEIYWVFIAGSTNSGGCSNMSGDKQWMPEVAIDTSAPAAPHVTCDVWCSDHRWCIEIAPPRYFPVTQVWTRV